MDRKKQGEHNIDNKQEKHDNKTQVKSMTRHRKQEQGGRTGGVHFRVGTGVHLRATTRTLTGSTRMLE